MKVMIKVAEENGKMVVPTGELASGDWFKCENCGYEIRKLVLGDTATCPECGGRMKRM